MFKICVLHFSFTDGQDIYIEVMLMLESTHLGVGWGEGIELTVKLNEVFLRINGRTLIP